MPNKPAILDFKHEIITKEKFSSRVEHRMLMSYADMRIHDIILEICEELEIEPEDCKKLLTQDLKAKLKNELLQLHMIKEG